jgi:colanic acid biosynthesis protein WcaH
MLSDSLFKSYIKNMPLVSIDIIVVKNNKILLGRRSNSPAKGYFFSIGGRIKKNESIDNALDRIAKEELNLKLKFKPKFHGVFEHFYDDGIYENVSTHYVNLAFIYNVKKINRLPIEQHDEYRWFDLKELKKNEFVHEYVKDYLKSEI